MKYPKIQSLTSDYRHYLGTIGAYQILFGHKVEKSLNKKANYIWRALCKQYSTAYTTSNNGRLIDSHLD
jgi:hypothetical protein